jgi:Flp pilus assembly protein TadD
MRRGAFPIRSACCAADARLEEGDMAIAERAMQRQEPRSYRCVFEAMAWFDGKLHDTRLLITDLSVGGAFVECGDPPGPGTSVDLVIAAGERQMLEARARVVHVVRATAGRKGDVIPGMGIQFLDLSGDRRAVLERVVGPEAAKPAPIPPKDQAAPPEAQVARPARSPFAELYVRRLAAQGPPQRHLAADLLKSARAAMDEGMFIRAASDLQLALGYSPDDSEIRALADAVIPIANRQRAKQAWLQGVHFESLAQEEEAARSFAEAAALNPDNADYQRKVADYALRRRDLQTALLSVREALRTRPGDAALHSLFADIHLAMGNRENAVQSAERAAALAPQDRGLRERAQKLRTPTR